MVVEGVLGRNVCEVDESVFGNSHCIGEEDLRPVHFAYKNLDSIFRDLQWRFEII